MKVKIGIILGSGLGSFIKELSSPKLIYDDNTGFHKLKIFKGKIGGKSIAIFTGRRHYYEGYSLDKILENIRIAKELGIEFLIVTNAAGGINKNFNVTDLMLINSHINFLKIKLPRNSNFNIYDHETITRVRTFAKENKIGLKSGSYCCMTGPVYESRSEIRFLSRLGVDAVGMSTVPEVIYANSLGIRTIAISCITNVVSEQSKHITAHEEVILAGKNSYNNFSELIKIIISDF